MIRKVFIFLVIYSFISCNEKRVNMSISNCHYGYQMELKEKVICNGDKAAYQKLLDIYSDDWNMGDMLSYSIIMANKFDDSDAYYDVFKILISLPRINANKCVSDTCSGIGYYCLDDKTKKIAVNYFIQAVYKGNIFASEELLNTFSINKLHPIKELYTDKKLLIKAESNLKR